MKKLVKNSIKYPIMRIVWDDHSSYDEYLDEDKIKAQDFSVQMVNVGWLVKENEKAYTLASGYTTDGDFDGFTTILKATVIGKIVLAKAAK
jgi:hypothetical protein